jgi:acetolactate synthase-1/2/3 large subunit
MDLEGALERAAAFPGPVVLDLRIPAEDEVYPMVPSGAGLSEMWMEAPADAVGR